MVSTVTVATRLMLADGQAHRTTYVTAAAQYAAPAICGRYQGVTMTRARKALEILRLMNEARRIGQGYAAELLLEQLDELDRKGPKRTTKARKPRQRQR
jgi:hypothetical protein